MANSELQSSKQLILIERMADGEKALLPLADRVPEGYAVAVRRYEMTPYDDGGNIKTLYRNLPVLYEGYVEICNSGSVPTGQWVSDVRYIVIQSMSSKTFYLRDAKQGVPVGYVQRLKYKDKFCHFESELTAACRKLPVLV